MYVRTYCISEVVAARNLELLLLSILYILRQHYLLLADVLLEPTETETRVVYPGLLNSETEPSKPISFVHYVQYLMNPRRICFVLPIVGAICLLVWRQQFDLLASSSSLLWLSANVTKQETAAALPVVPRRRILVLVSDYKPPNERLTDLLVHYQTSFVDHQNSNNNNNTNNKCRQLGV
jgi:hypothetical protein